MRISIAKCRDIDMRHKINRYRYVNFVHGTMRTYARTQAYGRGS
jgi:hypothetical protein